MEKRRVDKLHGGGYVRRHRRGRGCRHGLWSRRELGRWCWSANGRGRGRGSGYGLVESSVVWILVLLWLLLLQRLLGSAAGVELRVLLAVPGVDILHVLLLLLMIRVVLVAVGIVARVLLRVR